MTAVTYSDFNSQLPWSSSSLENKRFRRFTLICLALTLMLAAVVSFYELPEVPRVEKESLPPQLAKILKAKTPPPPPKVEPKNTPKPEPKPEPVEKVKPVETPKPVEKVVKPVAKAEPKVTPPQPSKEELIKTAREKAKQTGVLAFQDQLASLRDSVNVDNLANTELTKGAGQSEATARKRVGRKVTGTSGGFNSNNLTSDAGAKGTLQGRKTTEFEAPDEGAAQLATKQIVTESQVIGDRDVEAIRKVLDANKGAIYGLYRRALRNDPTLQGKLTVKLVIEADGGISDISLLASELEAPELEKKLLSRIRLINFGAANVTQTQLEYSFNFLPF